MEDTFAKVPPIPGALVGADDDASKQKDDNANKIPESSSSTDDAFNLQEIITKIKAEDVFEDGLLAANTSNDGDEDDDDAGVRALASLQLPSLSNENDSVENEEEEEEDGEVDYDDDDTYVCTLSEDTQQKAQRELGEVPDKRNEQVSMLRQWCRSQTGLKCPTDSRFLLTFLRARKFKQTEARSLLQRHLIMKTRMKGWFEHLDPCEPGIQAVLKEGFVYPLPRRNADGCVYLVFNYGKIEPWAGRYCKKDVLRAIVCVIYYLFFTDELNQVNGVCIINDLSCMTFKHKALFSIDEQKLFYGGWNKSIPARIKKICLYNVGSSLGDFVCMMLKVVTAEKLLQRIVNCGSSLSTLQQQVPPQHLPVEYLSADYEGPNGGSTPENIDRLMECMSEEKIRKRIKYISSPRFKVDLSKYSPSISQSLRKLIN